MKTFIVVFAVSLVLGCSPVIDRAIDGALIWNVRESGSPNTLYVYAQFQNVSGANIFDVETAFVIKSMETEQGIVHRFILPISIASVSNNEGTNTVSQLFEMPENLTFIEASCDGVFSESNRLNVVVSKVNW
jgi:hypothetical protein